MGALAPIPQAQDPPRWEPIPASSLQLLPFSAEPVSDWTEEGDICRFLVGMHSFESTDVNQAGEPITRSYASYGLTLFADGLRLGRQEAQRFADLAARPLPGAQAGEWNFDTVPDFAKDPSFGRAWKSNVAWQAITEQLLTESAFFSIGHTLEAEADLDVSVQLASRLYYKHSLQALRTMVEDVVMPLYFCVEPAQFEQWRLGQHATLPMRGSNGILSKLVADGALTTDLSNRVGELYKKLNGAIHTSEKHQIHRGSDYRKYRGETFKRDDFDEWTDDVAEVVTLGSSLVDITFERWQSVRREHPLMCDICHNWERFTMTRPTSADDDLVEVRCDLCQFASHYKASYLNELGRH